VPNARLERIVRVLLGLQATFDDHAATCGDRVLAIALSDVDWDELGVAEIWGLPVLAWDDIEPGRVKLLCEAEGRLIPPIDTVEDLRELWDYGIRPAAPSAD
jgi:hypothetical protein